ncbi:hypothetical protein K4H01_22745, partial [Mycobacterium tuberculosis]|nr:hypothetical protein [Mycobacterium tuberculosis]
ALTPTPGHRRSANIPPRRASGAYRNTPTREIYTTDTPIPNTLIHELDVLRWLLNDDYRSVQVRFPRSTSHTHARLKDPQIVSFETKKGTLIDVEVFVN